MKAITIRCPECGAKLSVSPDARESNCSYCGTKSQIQRRTGFFERVEAPARPPQAGRPMPIAVQSHSTTWIMTLIGIPVFMSVLAIPFIASRRADRALAASQAAREAASAQQARAEENSASTITEAPPPPTLTWLSQGAAAVDVNGDNILDVVGRIELRTPNRQDIKLAAFEGATGEPLWMSEELSLHSEDRPGRLVISGDTLVFPPNETSLRGFTLRDGSELWTTKLSEKLGLLCRGTEEGTIAVQTADSLWQTLTLADGSLTELQWQGPCLPLAGDSSYVARPGQLMIEAPFRYPLMALEREEGLRGTAAIYDRESKISIALVAKSPGTAVPMLARYEYPSVEARILAGDLRNMRSEVSQAARGPLDKKWYAAVKKVPKGKAKLIWSVTIPSADPLKATEGALTHRNAALQGDLFVVAYESTPKNFNLAAFDVEDGERRWEVGILNGGYFGQVLATPEHVYVVSRNGLSVYDLQTGESAYTIPADL